MKRFIKSKKGLALLATLVVAAAGAVAGYAYFTSTGTGTGSATVGSAAAWSIGQNGTASGGPLYPDPSIGSGHIQTTPWTVVNNGQGNQNLNAVTIRIADSIGGAWSARANTALPACTKSDFSVGGQSVGSDYTPTAQLGDFTSGQTKSTNVLVQMIDNGATQDNCQGVTVPLYFSAS
jgi:hypothetical protein